MLSGLEWVVGGAFGPARYVCLVYWAHRRAAAARESHRPGGAVQLAEVTSATGTWVLLGGTIGGFLCLFIASGIGLAVLLSKAKRRRVADDLRGR
jgi:hypothetical protein